MPPSTLLGWLSYIESQHPSNIELGLDRCTTVLNRLNFARPSKKIFTVAGTNGKGSTCAFLTKYFVSSQRCVGTFTSPHFLQFNERIAINGIPVDDEVICDAFTHIESIRGDTALTYFEFNTLAAIWIFSKAKLDYWVLEIGLGGRLDSVNMIDSDIALITSIALDHTDWLGDSLEIIAAEKAGIARKGKLFISGVRMPPVTLKQTAIKLGAIVKEKGHDFDFSVNMENQTWSWQGNGSSFSNLPIPSLPIENAATTLAALSYVGEPLTKDIIAELMLSTELIGRFQTISTDPHVILDVAHNPEAAEQLSRQITQLNKPVIALCGMLHDKDIKSVLSILESSFDSWYLVDLHEERGAKATDMSPYLENAVTYNTIEAGLDVAMIQAQKEDKILLIFGSFVTVGHSLTYFEGKER